MGRRKKLPDLTECQERALIGFAHLAKREPAPTIREWADHVGLAFVTTHGYRDQLMRMKLMDMTPGRTRSTRLTDYGRRYIEASASQMGSFRPGRKKSTTKK